MSRLYSKTSAINNIFILGGGFFYGIAMEAALKCMEMSSTNAFSFTFMESRHGPRSLIDENSLVVGLYSHSGLHYEAQVMDELTQKHKATTLALTPTAGWETGTVTASVSLDCDWPDNLSGLLYLPPLQLVAYYCAVSKGLNPDVARDAHPICRDQEVLNGFRYPSGNPGLRGPASI